MRVIAGRLRSRTLVAPRGTTTRPTTDRVREALFSRLESLGPLWGRSDVLDLYAGTGALGIEALSRGARSATFVESDREALRALRQNLQTLEIGDRARVHAAPVERARLSGSFALVFADPPYEEVAKGRFTAVFAALGDTVAGARVVLEHASRDAAPELAGHTLESTRAYGDSAVSFYLPAVILPVSSP